MIILFRYVSSVLSLHHYASVRALMNDEGFGGFPFSIATLKVLFLLLEDQLAHKMAEVETHGKINLTNTFYDFIKA